MIKHLKLEKHEDGKWTGNCDYRDVHFRIKGYPTAEGSVHRADGYTHSICVDVLDAEGKIMQSDQKRKAKWDKLSAEKKEKAKNGKRLEEFNASAFGFVKGSGERAIRAKAAEIVVQAYHTYRDDLKITLNAQYTNDQIHSATLFDMTINDFFRNVGMSMNKETQKKKKETLRVICNFLDEKSFADLTEQDVEKILPFLGGDLRRKLLDAQKFFDFVIAHRHMQAQNPVTLYLGAQQRTKRKEENAPRPPQSLTSEQERRLHQLIQETLAEDLSLAIPLIKGGGLSMKKLISLTWDAVRFLPDGCAVLSLYEDALTGGTRVYTRPVLRETSDFLRAKYEMLLASGIKKNKLAKMPVVPVTAAETWAEKKSQQDSGGMKKELAHRKKKEMVTTYIRRTLHKCGVSAKKMSEIGVQKAEGGAGYRLLYTHYEYVLRKRCCLEPDSDVSRYMRGQRLLSTTEDSYHCFSDATGCSSLATVANRDNLFRAFTPPAELVTCHPGVDWKSVMEFYQAPWGLHTMVQTNKPIFLRRGERLRVEAPHGIYGTLQAWTETEKPVINWSELGKEIY